MSRVFDNSTADRLVNSSDFLGVTAYPFTLAMWMKLTTITFAYTVYQITNDSVLDYNFRTQIVNTTSDIRLHIKQSATTTLDNTSDLIDTEGIWVPHIVTFDTNEITMYHGDDTDQNTVTQSYQTNDTPKIRFGSAEGATATGSKLAHITAWNKKLSAADIALFQQGNDPANIDSANQTRYWSFITTSLTDSVNSVVLTATNADHDATDNPPVITSVSTDDIVGSTENPWNITGTGFGTD